MTKLYAWLSSPHDGEKDEYPVAIETARLGVVAAFSTRRDLLDTDQWRSIAAEHARVTGADVRLVEADITDTLEVVHGNHGVADA